MKFTSELAHRISEELSKRKPMGKCQFCGKSQWILSDGFVIFPVTHEFPSTSIVIGGGGMPTVALVCAHCGNTAFINLIQLGLKEFLDTQ